MCLCVCVYSRWIEPTSLLSPLRIYSFHSCRMSWFNFQQKVRLIRYIRTSVTILCPLFCHVLKISVNIFLPFALLNSFRPALNFIFDCCCPPPPNRSGPRFGRLQRAHLDFKPLNRWHIRVCLSWTKLRHCHLIFLHWSCTYFCLIAPFLVLAFQPPPFLIVCVLFYSFPRCPVPFLFRLCLPVLLLNRILSNEKHLQQSYFNVCRRRGLSPIRLSHSQETVLCCMDSSFCVRPACLYWF